MSTIKEQQDEEREALISIYEGDQAFKEVNPQTFQYKVSHLPLRIETRNTTHLYTCLPCFKQHIFYSSLCSTFFKR